MDEPLSDNHNGEQNDDRSSQGDVGAQLDVNNLKPFPCPHCEKSYGSKYTLQRHIDSKHETLPAPLEKEETAAAIDEAIETAQSNPPPPPPRPISEDSSSGLTNLAWRAFTGFTYSIEKSYRSLEGWSGRMLESEDEYKKEIDEVLSAMDLIGMDWLGDPRIKLAAHWITDGIFSWHVVEEEDEEETVPKIVFPSVG